MSGRRAEASVKANAAEEAPKRVITYPEVANLIKFAAVIFSTATIGIYIHSVCTFFTFDGPWWQPYVLSAVALPFTILPLSVVPRLTDALIKMWAVAPPDNTGDGNLTGKPLLGSENV